MKRANVNFSKYMNDWLYGSDGYYSKFRQIGQKGDFYTAVSTTPFFGGSIAKHIISVIDEGYLSKNSVICEVGAHQGYLLADIVQFIYTLRPELLDTLKFAIVERFESVRDVQKRYFTDSFGDTVKLELYESLEDLKADEAFFIANEIFDAFGCELLHEGKIATVENNKITFDKDDEKIVALAKKYNQTKGEVAVGYENFALEMSSAAKRYEFLTFDYGELEARPDFSSRIYQKHLVFALFDENIKLEDYYAESDITYDVNFSHLIDAYEQSGAKKVGFKTQLLALVDFGIHDLLKILKDNVSQRAYETQVNKVKTLISPSFMGERFKMVRFRKG